MNGFQTPIANKRNTNQCIESPTIFITPNKTSFELEKRLKQALKLIREKDQDLVLAAEIGQKLLESNEELQREYSKIHRQYQKLIEEQEKNPKIDNVIVEHHELAKLDQRPHGTSFYEQIHEENQQAMKSKRDFDHDFITELEESNYEYALKIENLNSELEKKIEKLKNLEKELSDASKEISVLRQTHQEHFEEISSLKEDKETLIKEKNELQLKLKAQKNQQSNHSQLKQSLGRLEYEIYELKEAKLCSDREQKTLEEHIAQLQTQLEQNEELLEEYREYVNENEYLKSTIDVLTAQVQSYQDQIHHLENKISVFEPNLFKETDDKGGKSLLGEIEDRRKELEHNHHSLLRKHAGLMKAHTMTVHQQERMRNHIHRLTQLSNNKSSEEQLKLLEDALAQSESEKGYLLRRIEDLEKQLQNSSSNALSHFADLFGPSSNENLGLSSIHRGLDNNGSSENRSCAMNMDSLELIECFKVEIQKLKQREDFLNQELKTCNLLRLNDSDRVRKFEKSLNEKTREISKYQTSLAELSFKFEELRVKLKENSFVESENEPCATLLNPNENQQKLLNVEQCGIDSPKHDSVDINYDSGKTEESESSNQHILERETPRQKQHTPCESTIQHNFSDSELSSPDILARKENRQASPLTLQKINILPDLDFSNQDEDISDPPSGIITGNIPNSQQNLSNLQIPDDENQQMKPCGVKDNRNVHDDEKSVDSKVIYVQKHKTKSECNQQ